MEHRTGKKRAREEAKSRQKGALDTWIKRSRVEVEETESNEAAENSSDTSMESEDNNNRTVSSPSPCQDDDSSGEEKRDFNTFLQRNDFGYLKKPVSDNLKITIIQHGTERYQKKVVHLLKRMGDLYPSSGLKSFYKWRNCSEKMVVVLSISASMLLFCMFLIFKRAVLFKL